MTAETVTKFTCDRCRRQDESYERDADKIALPFRWVNILRGGEAANADTMDLCADCAKSFEDWRMSPPEGTD